MEITKRDGQQVQFNKEKIYNAIMKSMKYGTGIIEEEIALKVANDIEEIIRYKNSIVTVYQIEEMVYLKLIEYKQPLTAKAYEGYRAIQSFRKKDNTTDESILSLIARKNEEVMNENSNKNAVIASTQRDLIAGEVSKDITRRKKLPTRIVQAHDDGVLHFHK